MLDYLSDVGGLFDALAVIGNMIVSPFAAHALRNQLTSLVETDRAQEQTTKTFYCKQAWKRHIYLAKVEQIVSEQLDLTKFIARQKVQLLS
mmetsp:Transcript_17889/g.22478  ORF Transcript_17889/g.22478 Transcript_17889/m.22478 type:complete len:91 (+) Transcript_17889:941-1213(+)